MNILVYVASNHTKTKSVEIFVDVHRLIEKKEKEK